MKTLSKMIRNGFVTLALSFLVPMGALAQLSGTYQVGGSSPDPGYSEVSDAVDSLQTHGVNGAVTFNLAASTFVYSSSLDINNVSGVSATNTITFSGAGIGNTVIESGEDPIFEIDGVPHIHFEAMTIENTDGGNGFDLIDAHHFSLNNCEMIQGDVSFDHGFEIEDSDNLSFTNSIFTDWDECIYTPFGHNGGDSMAIVNNQFSNWDGDAMDVDDYNNVTIDSNDFDGQGTGFYTINMDGDDNTYSGVTIRNNEFSDIGNDHIWIDDYDDLEISGNTIIENGSQAMDLGGNSEVVVSNNTVRDAGTGVLIEEQGTNFRIDSNTVENVNDGIAITSDELKSNILIRDNIVDSIVENALELNYTQDVEVRRNKITRLFADAASCLAGVRIHDAGASGNILFQNNIIEHRGDCCAVCAYGDENGLERVEFVNNSIRTFDEGRALYMQTTDSMIVKNNNFQGNQNAELIGNFNSTNFSFNANNYDNPGSLYANSSNSYDTLSAWQNDDPENNQASFEQSANFVSGNDLHLDPSTQFPRGLPLGVDHDVDMDPRCNHAPSIGADESNVGASAPTLSGNISFPDTARPKAFHQIENNEPLTGRQYIWYVNGDSVASGHQHTYSPEDFLRDTMMVIARNCQGSDTLHDTVEVEAHPEPPVAQFVADNNETPPGENLQLNDLSKNGIAGWKWNIKPENKLTPPIIINWFWQENTDSLSQNPIVSFLETGFYDVCLSVYNIDQNGDKRWDTLCKTDYLDVGFKPGAEFNMCEGTNSVNIKSGKLFDEGGENSEYPEANSDKTCSFLINPCADTVVLTIKDMDIHDNFSPHWLRIYDGKSSAGSPLWNSTKYEDGSNGMNGDLSTVGSDTVKIATSGAAYIEWEQDEFDNASGFEIEWESRGVVQESPTAAIEGPDTLECPNVGRKFSEAVGRESENISYEWINDGNVAAGGEEFIFQPTETGLDTFYLVVNQCQFTDTVMKEVFVRSAEPLTQLDFEADILNPEAGNDPVTLTSMVEPCIDSVRWEIMPDTSITFVNGTDQNSRNPEIIFDETIAYDVKLIAGNPVEVDSLLKQDYIEPIGKRCLPEVSNIISDLGITRFALEDIDNSSDVASSGYTDYSANIGTTLEQGVEYTFTLERNTAFNEMTRKIWIDYNGDGDFDDPGERIAMEADATTATWSAQFTVPTQLPGGATKLRVGAFLDSANGPCAEVNYGEFEDYRVVISEDVTPPEITLAGDDTLMMETCEPLYNKDTGAMAIDNLDGNITDSIQITSNVDTASPGTYQINYQVSDASGNQSEAARTVIITPDTTDPVITLKGAANVKHPYNEPYSDSGYNADDACSGIDSVSMNKEVDVNELGTHEVTYTAYDNEGNSATVSRTIEIVDTVAPGIISTSSADTLTHDVHEALEDHQMISQVSDNYYDAEELTISRSGGYYDSFPNGVANSLGHYEVTISYSDPSGNSTSLNKVVHVVDRIAPEVELVGDAFVELKRWNETPYIDSFVVSDNYYDADELKVDTFGSYFSVYRAGNYPEAGEVYQIKYQVTDPSNNRSAVVERDVRIVENTGIEDGKEAVSEMKVFPNPTDGRVKIEVEMSNNQEISGKLLGPQGKVVREFGNEKVAEQTYELDLTGEAAGVYKAVLYTADGMKTESVVLTR